MDLSSCLPMRLTRIYTSNLLSRKKKKMRGNDTLENCTLG